MENKMNVKKLLVSFAILVSVLFLAVNVSAHVSDQTAGNVLIEVNGIDANDNPAIVAGETAFVRVEFDSLVDESDITVRVEIDGARERVEAETKLFDIEDGQRYARTLALEVPFDLKKDLSGFVDLNIKISGTDLITHELRLQRESFNVDILSVDVPQTVQAGNSLPVDVALKNTGYNDLDDLFVTARISALELERTAFFGDLVALECNNEDTSVENYGVDVDRKCIERKTDTSVGRISLDMPFDVEPGVYALELKVEGEDVSESETVQVVVKNSFPDGNFIVSGNQVLIVNPTNQLVVYNLVPKSIQGVSVSLSDSLVSVPAESSRTITADVTSNPNRAETFFVDVFSSDGSLVDTLEFSTDSGRSAASPIVILTIILAIIFVVLLVVLIVLIGKKPDKTEEFGESYY